MESRMITCPECTAEWWDDIEVCPECHADIDSPVENEPNTQEPEDPELPVDQMFDQQGESTFYVNTDMEGWD